LKTGLTSQDYSRAEKFLRLGPEKLVLNTLIVPRWIANTDRFWYKRETREGHTFVVFSPDDNIIAPAFDHKRLAESLIDYVRADPLALPISEICFSDGMNSVRFFVGGSYLICDLLTYRCREDEMAISPHELASPDGKAVVYVQNHNIHVRFLESGCDEQLTFDGAPYFDYGTSPESNLTTVTDVITNRKRPPVALWSPDSKKILVHKLDQRTVKEFFLIQSASEEDQHSRPILHSYKYPLVGDEDLATASFVVIDLEERSAKQLACEPEIVTCITPIEMNCAWWALDSSKVYCLHRERGDRALALYESDLITGKIRLLIEERSKTHVEPNLVVRQRNSHKFDNRPNVHVLSSGEFIWFSERDGWAHLYLYDNNGSIIRQLTHGEYVVRELLLIDEQERQVYFTAGGREKGRDPYFRHLYRVSLNDENPIPQILTPEDADHFVRFSPTGRYFVDTFSTVDSPPTTMVRRSNGEEVTILERADISRLVELGWRPPERFSAKAADGVSDIYGVIYRPMNFISNHSYPVIDDIYPGPGFIRSAKSFDPDPDARIWFWHPQALAELGFIVVTIDGRGSAFRSKAFHDVGYGKYERYCGLADHISALHQLKERYPYFDLRRVGIYGHSAGGYASARAILEYPEFFKVAVSSSGNHDQRGYVPFYGERYQGLLHECESGYAYQANQSLASNLGGKLLLVHGDMDENVHPSMTIRLAFALIKANKDFDFLILPGRNHNLWTDPYFIRRRWDYFVRHLLGAEPPNDYAVGDLPSEDHTYLSSARARSSSQMVTW
jgi:dipeptidyl aminopeptidase/acylaminoacyl peptidase